jgi:anti-sigma regulatory factor (Ser/Thr protein kinase)
MEVVGRAIIHAVKDLSQTGEVRRAATGLAAQIGFDDADVGKVAIVATELARNIAIHGGGGQVVLRHVSLNECEGIDLLAMDQGPGMADVGRCLRDGFSSVGTAGIGLGAVQRFSSCFDIFSAPGMGTTVFSRLWQVPPPPPAGDDGQIKIGAVSVPHSHETVCGDAWATAFHDGRVYLAMADGLGHGLPAYTAASEAMRLFRENLGQSPEQIMQAVHRGLGPTRGAAVAILDCDRATQQVRYCGIGNISAAIYWPGGALNLTSHNGTVGHILRKAQEFTYRWPSDGLLVAHTDGLRSPGRPDRYPGLMRHDPNVVAAVLYRDYGRAHDDATVLALRQAAVA